MRKFKFTIIVVFILTLCPSLHCQTGSVRIESLPSGAKVIIDGKTVGITPYTLIRNPGSYWVSITKEGYNELMANVQIANNDVIEDTLLILQPKLVNITVSIEGNSNDSVWLDGKKLVPISESFSINPGPHTFVVKQDLMEDVIHEVIIPIGKDTSIVISKSGKIKTGTLMVNTNVERCKIIVDDVNGKELIKVYLSEKDTSFDLRVGIYYITVSKFGYYTEHVREKFVVEWNKITSIKAKLESNKKDKFDPKFRHFVEFEGYFWGKDFGNIEENIGGDISYNFLFGHWGGYVTLGTDLSAGTMYSFAGSNNNIDFQLFAGLGYEFIASEHFFNIGSRIGWWGKKIDKSLPYSISLSALFSNEGFGMKIGMNWRFVLWTVGITCGIALSITASADKGTY